MNSTNIIEIAKSTVQLESGELMSLEYFLRCFTGPEGEALYGLRVDMRRPDGQLVERQETEPLTGSIEEATVLAEAFAAGTVMPYVLLEMVEEWFCPETTQVLLGKQLV